MNRVSIAAHAKANLKLRVLNREPSGYHNLETLFALLELHDVLEVERIESGIELSTHGAEVGPEQQNLAFRAADRVLAATGRKFGVKISLTKSIPVQAGLGGGSSDGAAALHAVNLLADEAVPERELLEFGAKLGSDVPFFVSRAAFAIGRGRGERITEVAGPRAKPALVLQPEFGVSTRGAYESLAASRSGKQLSHPPKMQESGLDNWPTIVEASSNDFEEVLFAQMPRLYEHFTRLANTGPIMTRLCGSGSAIIAVYSTAAERDDAKREFTDVELVIPTQVRARRAPEPVPA